MNIFASCSWDFPLICFGFRHGVRAGTGKRGQGWDHFILHCFHTCDLCDPGTSELDHRLDPGNREHAWGLGRRKSRSRKRRGLGTEALDHRGHIGGSKDAGAFRSDRQFILISYNYGL